MATEGLIEIKPWVCGDFIVAATDKGRRVITHPRPMQAE